MTVLALSELFALQGLYDAFEGRSWDWSGHAAASDDCSFASVSDSFVADSDISDSDDCSFASVADSFASVVDS